jgi:DNA-binding beta-propeller fold protein YncE
MRALWLVLVVAACGGKAPMHAHHEDDVDGDAERDEARHEHDADPDDERPHAIKDGIETIAVTADGVSAVTADSFGRVKLWPVIGSKGIAVDVPAPRAFALAHDSHGFELFEIDAAGDLVITTIDAAGTQHAHATLANDPAFVGLAIITAGVVAWRTDHTIVVVNRDGRIAAQLAAPPGDHVVMVAAAGSQAVALLETKQTRRLRHLALDKLAWGAWVGGDVLSAIDIALAPTGKRLVILLQGDAGRYVDVIDALTGKTLAAHGIDDARTIAFVDANHAAIVGALRLYWIDVSTAQDQLAQGERMPRRTVSPSATGGGQLVLVKLNDIYTLTPP